jgi:hypothetical protein
MLKTTEETKMKISKRQLRKIIKEEKAQILREQNSPGDAIAAVEQALIASALEEIMSGNRSFTDQIYTHAIDGAGLEDPEVQMALDQLMDRYSTRGR